MGKIDFAPMPPMRSYEPWAYPMTLVEVRTWIDSYNSWIDREHVEDWPDAALVAHGEQSVLMFRTPSGRYGKMRIRGWKKWEVRRISADRIAWAAWVVYVQEL